MPETARIVSGVSIPSHALAEWRALAAVLAEHGPAPCESVDAEEWWPARGQETYAPTACRRCPAREACLGYALAAGEREGIWGGLTPDQRRTMVREAA